MVQNLEAGALCYTMCSNYRGQLLAPLHEPFLENNGRFSFWSMLPGFELELLGEFVNRASVLFTLH